MYADRCILFLARGWLPLCLLLASLGSPAAELPDVIDRVKPAVVGIGTYQKTRRPPVRMLATGFVVADGLHAVTNAHSIRAELDTVGGETLVVLVGEDSARPAAVRKTDPVHDLALLAFKGKPLEALELGDSDRVREGELYAFTGFPLSLIHI